MEKSFCHDLQHRIMIHPYDTVQPTGMGMVEIPVELAKAICLHIKSISKSVKQRQKTYPQELLICYNDLVKRMYFAVITRKGVIITRDK